MLTLELKSLLIMLKKLMYRKVTGINYWQYKSLKVYLAQKVNNHMKMLYPKYMRIKITLFVYFVTASHNKRCSRLFNCFTRLLSILRMVLPETVHFRLSVVSSFQIMA